MTQNDNMLFWPITDFISDYVCSLLLWNHPAASKKISFERWHKFAQLKDKLLAVDEQKQYILLSLQKEMRETQLSTELGVR